MVPHSRGHPRAGEAAGEGANTLSAAPLTTGSLARRSFTFGGPLAVAMMGHGLFNLVDLVIVGRLDEGSISAVTIAGIALTVAMLFFDGVSTTAVALVAWALGSERRDMASRCAGESFQLSLVSGALWGGLFFVLARPAVEFFGLNTPEVVESGVTYFRVLSVGMVTMFLIMQTTAILRGIGDVVWPVIILIGANALNIFLDIALVYGHWGFPEMGVEGAAWATIIARGVGAAVGILRLVMGTHGVRLDREAFKRPFMFMRPLLVVGLPTSAQLAVRVLVVFFLLKIATDAYTGPPRVLVDSVGICIRLEMVAVFLGMGWGAAATTIVGQNLGAGHPRRALRGTWWLVVYAAITMGIAGGLLIWLRRGLLVLVMPEIPEAGVLAGLDYLDITIPIYPFLGAALVLSRGLNGATSTKTPMAIDIGIALIVQIPLALLLSKSAGPRGVWYAAAVGHLLSVLIYVAVFWRGKWKNKKPRGLEQRLQESEAKILASSGVS